MNENDLNNILSTPTNQPLDEQAVGQLTERYPAFLLPAILQLRHPHPTLDDNTVKEMISRIALSIPDPTRTRLLIDPEGTGRYDYLYPTPQAASTPGTADAIDTFLSTYGNIDPAEEELLNRMIFNPVPDYAATLERDTPVPDEPRDEQDRLLDAFIAADKTPLPAAEQAPAAPKAPAGSLLSQSLAKIFIKQHNYRGAYEIISSLSLNYPEKSIYFADQLRFLQKLIANQEAQQKSKTDK